MTEGILPEFYLATLLQTLNSKPYIQTNFHTNHCQSRGHYVVSLPTEDTEQIPCKILIKSRGLRCCCSYAINDKTSHDCYLYSTLFYQHLVTRV